MKICFQKSWILAAIGAFALIGCGGGSTANLAIVNGEAITLEQYYNFLEAKPEVQVVLANGQVANARVADTIAFQALQDLIRQRIIVQLAKDEKLNPSADDLEKEVKFQLSRDSEFVKKLQARGLTLAQIKESLEVDLSRERLLTKGITITDAELDEFINTNRKEFTEPAQISSKWIFVKDEAKMRQVDRALNAGDTFATIARRFSDDPNAKTNMGQFGNPYVDSLPKPIADELNATQEGKETKWIKLQDGWAKFSVEKKIAAKYKAPTDIEKQWIRRQLAVKKGLQANDLDKRLLEKLKGSKIEIVYDELKDPWKNAWDRIKSSDPNKIEGDPSGNTDAGGTAGTTGTDAGTTGTGSTGATSTTGNTGG